MTQTRDVDAHVQFQYLEGKGKRISSSRPYKGFETSLSYRSCIKGQNKNKTPNIEEQAKQGSQIVTIDNKVGVHAEK